MARFVLLEFDDNEEADAFVESLEPTVASSTLSRHVAVRGVYGKPTQFCDCLPESRPKTQLGGYRVVTGQKFGWVVCPNCKKTLKHMSQHPKNLFSPAAYINGVPSYRLEVSPLTHSSSGDTHNFSCWLPVFEEDTDA